MVNTVLNTLNIIPVRFTYLNAHTALNGMVLSTIQEIAIAKENFHLQSSRVIFNTNFAMCTFLPCLNADKPKYLVNNFDSIKYTDFSCTKLAYLVV